MRKYRFILIPVLVFMVTLLIFFHQKAVFGAEENNSYIIVGENAKIGDLIAALHLAEGLGIPLRNIRTDSDVLPEGRIYLIGGGSVNKISKKLGYVSARFIIRPVIVDTVTYEGRQVTVLAGYEASDTRSAVEIYLRSKGV